MQKRNKPKEPPTVPKAAPFFIPTLAGLNPAFDLKAGNSIADRPKISNKLQILSPFHELMLDCANSSNYGLLLETLKELGPSSIDAEFRTLDILLPEEEDEDEMATEEERLERPLLLLHFLKAMKQGLALKKDFELIQAWLALFLKIHADLIMADEQLLGLCHEISTMVDGTWDGLNLKFQKTLCIINYLRSAIV